MFGGNLTGEPKNSPKTVVRGAVVVAEGCFRGATDFPPARALQVSGLRPIPLHGLLFRPGFTKQTLHVRAVANIIPLSRLENSEKQALWRHLSVTVAPDSGSGPILAAARFAAAWFAAAWFAAGRFAPSGTILS
jgi:hypothetical protein